MLLRMPIDQSGCNHVKSSRWDPSGYSLPELTKPKIGSNYGGGGQGKRVFAKDIAL